MKVLVINLDSAKDRRDFQANQLSSYQLDYTFLNAISTRDIEPKLYQKHHNDWQRPLKETEVACYYSHRSAWQRVIDEDQPMLILEDDALLSRRTPALLSILESRSDADFINLENRGRKKFVSREGEQLIANTHLFKLHQDRSGAAGYILWPSGAKKLLIHEQKHGIALADAHITDCHALQAFQVEPSPIIQLDYCEHYRVKNPTNASAIKSTVSSHNNPSGGLAFIGKKLLKQLQLGIRQLGLIFISTRRYIDLDNQDFDTK